MRRWRPCSKAIYVLSEIHGNSTSLEVILNRIFPLRMHTGKEDICIFLGDYIDGIQDGHKVIDLLINIKQEYDERVICLRGNHEQLLINAIDGDEKDFNYWCDLGGRSTIKGYLERSNQNANEYSIQQNRLKDIIPIEHIDFLKSLPTHYIQNGYFFMHGGFDYKRPIKETTDSTFMFDYNASKYMKQCVKEKNDPGLIDDYIFCGAHNFNSNDPYIHKRYIMLGGSAPSELLVLELNSMEMCRVKTGKTRIYPYEFRIVE